MPRDIKLVTGILVSRKIRVLLTFIVLMWLTVLIYLLAMSIATRSLPSFVINESYGELFLQHLLTAPGKLPSTAIFYWEYPAFWFTFNRQIDMEMALQLLVMDTTISFPVNIRYFVEFAPVMGLVTIHIILSGYMRGMNAVPKNLRQRKLAFLSVGLPSGSSSLSSALAPMACCGATAIQTTATVLGLAITAPAVMLFSRIAVILVAALLIVSIARTARKINSGCSCKPVSS